MENNEQRGMVLGLMAVVAFSFTLPATKILVPFMDPIFIGLGRSFIAAILAAIILLISGKVIPSKRQFFQLYIVTICIVVSFPVFTASAMLYLPSSHGAIVVGMLPLSTALAGALISGERPSLGFWVFSLLGSAVVVCYALIQGAGILQRADLALFMAVISASIGYAVGAKLSKELSGWRVISWALVLSLPLITIPVIKFAPDNFFQLPMKAYLGFFYLALISQLLAFFAWYKALAIGGVTRVSQIQLLQTFLTVLASALLLGEAVDTQLIIFTCLTVCLVWFGKKMPIVRSRTF